MSHTLEAQKRSIIGKTINTLRSTGLLPGVVYGYQKENQAITVDPKKFKKLYEEVGASRVIDLSLDGESKPVLIREIQRDPVSDTITHVDFFHVDEKRPVTAKINIELTGEAPAVKALGGILVSGITKLHVKALPKDLVSSIEVDLSPLDSFDKTIRVKDLEVAGSITILSHPQEAVATVLKSRVAKKALEAEKAPGAEDATDADASAEAEKKAE